MILKLTTTLILSLSLKLMFRIITQNACPALDSTNKLFVMLRVVESQKLNEL
jgi:hypothetical protein